ncbi:MAG: hypothetical protein OEV15_04090 [Gallionella sp.]|nr:hypothetical protein [Gallionella sp.]
MLSAVEGMEEEMKYFFAFLIIPTIPILLIVIFGFGALYFAVENLMERKRLQKITGPVYMRSARLKASASNIIQAH